MVEGINQLDLYCIGIEVDTWDRFEKKHARLYQVTPFLFEKNIKEVWWSA